MWEHSPRGGHRSRHYVLMVPWVKEFSAPASNEIFYRLYQAFDEMPYPRFSNLMAEMNQKFKFIEVGTSYTIEGETMTKVTLVADPYLVEGSTLLNSFSAAIKYLARERWSHAVSEIPTSLQSVDMGKGLIGGYDVNPIATLGTENKESIPTSESPKEVITIKKEKEVKLNLIQL